MTYTFTTANLDWATGLRLDRPHLEHLQEFSDALTTQETKTLRIGRARLARVLGPEWQTFHNISTVGKAGAALAVKKASGLQLHAPGLWLGGDTAKTPPRWMAHAELDLFGEVVDFIGAHDFPRWAGGRAAQLHFCSVLREHTLASHRAGHGWIVGTDANLPVTQLASWLNGVAYGDGIVGLITSRNVRVGAHGPDTFGLRTKATDHPAYWIKVADVRPAHRA